MFVLTFHFLWMVVVISLSECAQSSMSYFVAPDLFIIDHSRRTLISAKEYVHITSRHSIDEC